MSAKCVYKSLSSFILIGLILLNIIWVGTVLPVLALPQITLKWAKATGTGSTAMGPLAADLNNDGLMEIVKTGENGIAVLNPITGNVIWSAPYGGYHCPPEIIDLDKDGLPEILVSGAGIVALRGNNGSVYWHNYNAAGGGTYMAVGDIDADGYPEIYSAEQGKITALTHDGRIFAQTSTYYTCWGGMSIGDTDFDGVFEVYLGERSEWYPSYPSGGRGLRAFWASNLTERWSYPDILCSSQTPILADVDEDGKLEIIVCNQNRGGIAVIRTDGSIYRKQDGILPGYGCHSNPPVFDVDGDGHLELVACGDASHVPSKPWIWDLVDWKRDAVLPFPTDEPPGLADVDGDGKVEIIDCTPSNVTIFKYNSASTNYDIIGTIPLGGAQAFSIAQDIDGDGKLELVFNKGDYVYCYDVETPAPIPRPRTGLQFYNQYRTRSPFYTPPPGPQKPFLDNEQPADGSTGVEFNPILSIRVRDWQQDKMNVTFRTNATTGVWHDIGKYTNIGNGVYSQATTGMSSGNTKYWWSVEAEDSKGLSDEKIFSFTTRPPASWWDSAWKNRKLITIDPSKVDSDLRDFPVLIDITDADVGLHARLDAWDIVFTDYSSGEQLNHEIELYDGGAGHLVAWVNVPFVYSTKPTQLYIYYGNPTVSESQENTTGVWDPSLLVVQHLNETAGIHYDSTSNHNDGTPYGAVNQDCAGKIAGCDEFNGGYVELPRVYSSETQFTFSAWIYPRSGARYFISEWNNYQGAFLQISADSQVQLYVNSIFVSRPITLNEWHYIVGTFDGSSAKLYVDGSVPSIVAASSPTWPLQNAYIGDRSDHQRKFNGFIDEVRLSNPARSSYWIMTEYNNQKDPSTFYTIGPEEVFETPQAPVISNPFPPDGAVSIELNPTLSVDVTDHQGDPLTVTFSTNSTGTWQDLGVYTGGNGVYTQATTTMDYEDTTYWWRVQASDATHLTSQIYQFKTQPDMGNWWNINWKYRRVITIDPSKVSSDQTDFPVVVDLTDSGLTSKAQVDGDDFVFTDENNVKLDHEIESYDSTTGHLIVWVRVPYLSSTTDTVLYMYYGNPKAPNQENPAAVWDASYKLVLHLSETHECRMWGMIADSLPHDVVLDQLIYDPSSLKVLGGNNRDGWGLVWYDSSDPEIRRGPLPASTDPNFDLAANEMADSGAWIGVGHVRARSSGGIPPWGNPHPFMRYKDGKWWAFSHNGNLNKDTLKSLIGPEYLAANPPTYGTNWDDSNCIDSDLYELYVLKCIEANGWNVILGIAQAVTDITELDLGAANFILTDGETLWGFRKGNTLSYYYKATSPQYSVIASQPPDPAQPGWVSLSDYNLITLTKNNPPSIITDIRQKYPLLVDSDLSNSVDSADLRTNGAGQDWYESRNDLPTLLFLDESDIGGNTGKKAGFTANSGRNAYLTQEFSSAQTGTFSVQWDIYVDSILDISQPDRAGIMLIGDDSGGTNGPNSADGERFVFLAFHKDGGATSGTADLVWMDTFDIFTPIASVNLDQWYTIKVVLNLAADTYDVYLDGVFIATVPACTAKTSVTHISFAQWNDGAGAFYVDNIFSPTADRYKLTITTEGNGSVAIDPAESSYTSGSKVELTAFPDSGWMFTMWKGDASGIQNPLIITMDGHKTITANFTEMLLVDSEFNDSPDSSDLRTNTAGQDWYESRGDVPTLLFLDETDVYGNAGKKAGFSASASGNAYLTQEFSSPQTGVFSVQWDIYVDSVLAGSASKYRAGQMMIGSTSASYGPNRNDAVRFVFLAFYKLGGGTSGTADLVAMLDFNTQITVASNLNLDQWYTIKVVVNVTAGTYDVYVDGEFKATVEACTALSNVTHISFAQWDDGAGAFYVDNVFAPAVNRYKLTVNVVGNGSVTVNPGESTYAAGAEVDLTAIADPGFVFSGWSGDLIDHVNPITITMDSDKVVTATFIEPQYALTINIVGTGSVTKNPDKSTYTYGESVNLTASPSVGWSFLYWSGDLSGSQNPATIIMDGDKIVTARFIQEGTCIDSTINGNDGALYGGVTQGALGIIGGAYEFYGGYVGLPRVCSDESSFTFSAWIYPRSGARYFISEWNNYQGAFLQISADSEAQLYVNGKFVSKPITLNEWHYVVGTFDGSVAKLFVDAGISPSTTATSPIWPLQDMYIGDRSDHLRKFNGFIDEVRVSNIARSDSWIATEYNNQHSPSTFYVIAPEETVVIPSKPVVANPDPANGATDVPVTLAELSFTLTDYQGDLMDYYVSTYPDIGSDSATGVSDGTYKVAVSGLQYQTTYTWHVNVTDGTHWTNRTFTFTTLGELLVDPEFNDSTDSADLRANSPEQDWYESRGGWDGGVPTLLFLDESDVGGNTGKKAGFTASSSGNAYLTQEFKSPQTGTFSVQWDIYVDSILDISSPDRAGIMLIGSDLDAQKGPSSVDSERFVFLAFYKDGGATSGPVDLVAMSSFSSFTTVASGLNLKEWHTIKVVVNVTAGNYDIYVNGVYKATVNACTKLTSVTHISFAQWNDGAGAFYIDNVYASTVKLFTLTVNVVGKGLVQKDPDQATYTQGTEVKLTAIADPGWAFAGWSGDLTGTENPTTILMNSNKTVTATFTKVANEPPVVSNPEPADGATNVPVSTSRLNFTISDADGDLMDYYVSTAPDIGGESHTGVSDGTYSLSVSNLAYGTTYQWWINVTDGTHWTNMSYTFTTETPLLVDSEFNDSVDSADLRTNGVGQDWYESRAQVPTLLFLDESDIGGNTGKKAGFTASSSGNAYLTQEFSSPQTGVFTVQWDIYVDSILDISSPDRAGFMLIGADLDASGGPNRNDAERFVFLGFYKNGGGTTGTMDLVAMSKFDTFTTVASGLNMKQWYTIKVVVNVPAGTYDIYVDGVLKATKNAATKLASLTHISSAQWDDGAGAFYVDNVFSPATDRYKLTVNIVGNGSITVNPGESSYASSSEVELTAILNAGWEFTGWSGDLAGSENPINVTMDSDKNITATFTEIINNPPVVSNPQPANETTDVLVSTSLLNFTISDADGDLMDYYVSTIPDIGSDNAVGVLDGSYSLSVSGLAYGTTYTWWVNVTDGTVWTNMSYTFTTETPLLVDSEFNDSADSAALRANGAGQDWYESRNNVPTLLFLDTNNVGGDASKKAGFTASEIGNAYLSQEFSSAQTGVFTVQWDIYVDSVLKGSGSNYRAGIMMIGRDGGSGPNRNVADRFVYMVFSKPGGGTSGTMSLIAISPSTTIATNLNLKQWYTIKVVVNVAAKTYDVYVDGVFKATVNANAALTSLTYISFAQWDDGAGAFYVDNVFAPAVDRYKLTVNVDGDGIVAVNPGESSYAVDSVVSLTPTAGSGYMFDYWELDSVPDGSDVPYLVTMDADHVVTAVFTAEANVAPAVSDPEPAEAATGVSVSISLLNFTISDADADSMDYYVSTVPDIGSDTALGVFDGTYSLSVSGLTYGTTYTWWVNVTDGTDWTNVTYTFTIEAHPLEIETGFDSASIGPYAIEGNEINFTLVTETLTTGEVYTYWTYFKVTNTLGKEVTFRITNAAAVPFLSTASEEAQMVYSYDGDNWFRFTTHSYSGGIYTFTETFTNNEVYIATFFPFSYAEMQDYIDMVSADPDASKTVLGSSEGGRDIALLKITNSSIPDTNKKVIYIIGRQHSAETASSHMLKGMIDFLISDNTDAERMRDAFVWYIVPMVNPDGVYLGKSRGTSEDRNANRDWLNDESVEINIVRDHINSISSSYGIDFFIDWHSQMDDESWYNYVYSPPGNTFFSILSAWTNFDTQSASVPGSGSPSSCTAREYISYNVLYDPMFVFEPTPHLYTWTIASLKQEGVNVAYAINEYFPPTIEPLLVDSEFNDSVDSADLRANNATAQDWYESRAQVPTLLFLDETDVGGNTGKKAGFTASASGNAYLTQEFSSAQTGVFSAQWDIYVDSILAGSASKYRAGQMMIGSTSASYGPNRNDAVRFVFLAFYKSGGGDSGTADLVAMLDFNTQITVASGLNLDQWYTIRVAVDVATGTYDVYVDGVFMKNVEACTALSSLTHISFAQWDDGAGAFYVDNVFSPAVDRYKLTVNVDGEGAVTADPGESSYADGAVVSLTPTPDSGYIFDHWELDSVPDGSDVPYLVTMDAHHVVTAVFTAEANVAPEVSNPEPADAATNVPVSISMLNFTISDGNADLMNYYVSTKPNIGSDSASGVSDGAYSLAVSGLNYGTEYTWWVNVTDGTGWTNMTFTFTTEPLLLVDSEFNNSADSADLRANNATAQDWYESRNQAGYQTLLFLDTSDIGGDTSKKAGFTASSTGNAYLSQEFSSAQSGTFSVQWDIYVDSILDISGTDAAAWMMIGDNSGGTNGPNSAYGERFVYMAFYKNGGGTSGTMDLFCRQRNTDTRTTIVSLNLDQWYTIRVVVNVAAGTYDVYVDAAFMGTYTSRTAKTSVTHISFAQWNDGAGAFYVDNVFAPAQDRYRLTVSTIGNGSVQKNLSEATYASNSIVTLTAVADPDWFFSEWSGNLTGSQNPINITMDGDKTVTATFTEILESFTIIVLPDTQFYSESYPGIFANQTQWIVDNVAGMNILFVLHEGDIVNNDITAQWLNANASMSLLDGHVPWAVLPGNHDGTNWGTPSENLINYNTYFSYGRFSDETWYGDAYNNINTNSFVLFSSGEDDYIIFNLQYHPSDAVLAWANTTIALYPDRRAIVVTHDYLDTDGTRTTEGNHIWNSFVSHHADQIFLVLCGHMHGEARCQDIVNGHVIYQILADYQTRDHGGDGWLRILEFRPEEDKIYVKTFSPYLNSYETDADSEFILGYDMTASALSKETLGDHTAIDDTYNVLPSATNILLLALCVPISQKLKRKRN